MRWPRGASGGSPSHDRRPFTSASDVRHAQAVSRCRRGELLPRAAEPPLRRGGACRAVERARADPLPAGPGRPPGRAVRHPEIPYDERSEEHTSELQSLAYLVCRLLLEKKKKNR